jgi:hypothetical protein
MITGLIKAELEAATGNDNGAIALAHPGPDTITWADEEAAQASPVFRVSRHSDGHMRTLFEGRFGGRTD